MGHFRLLGETTDIAGSNPWWMAIRDSVIETIFLDVQVYVSFWKHENIQNLTIGWIET